MPNSMIRRAAVGARFALVLLSAVVVASADPVAADPPRFALPACYAVGTPPTERPTQVSFQTCADGSKELTGLTWTRWGAGGADGTGTYSYQVCEPNCAAGHRESFTAVVHADEPQAVPPGSSCPSGTQLYANLVIAFPSGTPAADGGPLNTRFNGHPATLYSTVGNDGSPTFLGNVTC